MTIITRDPVHEEPLHVRGVPLSRVVGVELRKMLDTRAGFWLQIAAGVVLIACGVMLPRAFDPRAHQRARPAPA